jgi:hypothetical protein
MTLGAAPYTPERPSLWARFAAAVEWLVELPARRRERAAQEQRIEALWTIARSVGRLPANARNPRPPKDLRA